MKSPTEPGLKSGAFPPVSSPRPDSRTVGDLMVECVGEGKYAISIYATSGIHSMVISLNEDDLDELAQKLIDVSMTQKMKRRPSMMEE